MPRLVRFYGGAPMQWLDDTPIAVVRACMEQLPVIDASEALGAANVTALGSGVLSKADSKRFDRELRRAAGVLPTAKAAPLAKLPAHGIAVTRVTPTGGAE